MDHTGETLQKIGTLLKTKQIYTDVDAWQWREMREYQASAWWSHSGITPHAEGRQVTTGPELL